MDLYSKIAKEENVSRILVKTTAIPFMYGIKDYSPEELEMVIRRAIQIFKKLEVKVPSGT